MFAHARAPVRIGIAGGGTDLPAWASEREGLCLNLAIKTYAHAVAITRPDRQVVASYKHLDIEHAATEIKNGLIRESALLHGWEDGFEVHTLSEVPSHGSGLGVSSALAVCLVEVFAQMRRLASGVTAEPRWRDGGEDAYRAEAARAAWTVEIDRLRRPIGRQDHMAAAWGGLRLYGFRGTDATVERTFSKDDARWVASHLVLLRLPDGHDARTILSGVKDPRQLENAYLAVTWARRAIEEQSLPRLGRAVGLGHSSKLLIPGAVPSRVAALVKQIEEVSGVYGCKVAGAGGGGHLVVVCEPSAVRAVELAAEISAQRVEPDFTGVRSEGWA